MRAPDKFEQIAEGADFPVCFLGNTETADYELLDLKRKPLLPESEKENLLSRGLCFIGVMGIVEGVPAAALAEPLDAATASALAQAYLRYFIQRVFHSARTGFNALPHPKGDTREN